MKRLLGLSDLGKNLTKAAAVAAVLAITTCSSPDSAQAKKKCSLISPCPSLSGSPNAGQFNLDFDIDFSDLNSSTGLFPDVIQNARYTACVPSSVSNLGLSSGCPTFSLFFDSSYLISSSLPDDDFKFPKGTSYETLVRDQDANFLKFAIFLPSSDHDSLYSLMALSQYLDDYKVVQLSSSSLNSSLTPSSGGVLPIQLTNVPENSTNVPENPMSVLLGTGALGIIVLLKRVKRPS